VRGPVVVRETRPRRWFVVQTAMHAEEDAAAALRGAGFETYLPKMRKELFSRRSKKVTTRTFLLFNRYLFAELPGDPAQWAAVWEIEEIAGVMGNDGIPQPVKDAEVARFRAEEADLAFDDTEAARVHRKEVGRSQRETLAMRFHKGRKVRALSGPFGGHAGEVVSLTGRGTVKAMLSLFGQMTLVEFAPEGIEPA
jgi:transcription antitermination factor NusG